MSTRRPVESLLPELPNDEPWYELKFQLRELDADLHELLSRLQQQKTHLGLEEKATQLWSELYELYILEDHDAEAHAPRAVQLAQSLLTLPPEAVPEWGDAAAAQRCDFTLPTDVLACDSLSLASSKLAQHLEGAIAHLSEAHLAIQHALDARGPAHTVLGHVLPHAMRVQQLLQGPVRAQVQSAWQWSVPYWRLMVPEAAAAHDARVAAAEAELAAIEAELDAGEPKKS
ncbi:hypothetical protein [Archangium violaceum]|uniref:Uncharacterized protein n=1 Tax=Archangium violaceum Cb vi76 TaxID=1406225 RepID=A0A084SKW1_9BACT|nr:hypothetical protein [Archangium violaceum]KFA89096.1 hypothetical protein Q664_37000 [Archangium violaceum Cb vi76]